MARLFSTLDRGGEPVRWWVSTKALRWAAVAFAGLAILAGGLQLWAFAVTDGTRHLIVGIFAASVGASVLVAAVNGFGAGT